jgi:hypothetical protein
LRGLSWLYTGDGGNTSVAVGACLATEVVALEFPDRETIVRHITRETRWVGPAEGSDDFHDFYRERLEDCPLAPAQTVSETVRLPAVGP